MPVLTSSPRVSPDGCFKRGVSIFKYFSIFGAMAGLALIALPWRLSKYDVWIYLFSVHDTPWFLACAIGAVWLMRTRETITPRFGTPIYPAWRRCENLKDKEDPCVSTPCQMGVSMPQIQGLIISRALSKPRHPLPYIGWTCFEWTTRNPATTIFYMLLFVFLFTSTGSYYIYHEFPLSLDEFMAVFQSEIIKSGNWVSILPPDWVEFARALQPSFMKYDMASHTWWPAYLPVNGALIASFSWLGLDNLSSPFMAVLSIFFLYKISCILWPDDISPRIVSTIILATSTQFLITSLTPYAMPAHLAFNMLWLFLFLKDKIIFHFIAALIGAAAIGLHQPHNFLFFSAPFLFYLIIQKRFSIFLLYFCILSFAFLYWIQWPHFPILSDASSTSTISTSTQHAHSFLNRVINMLSKRNDLDITAWLINIFRFFAWQHLLLIPLTWISIRKWNQIPTIFKVIFLSGVISIVPYILLMPIQGHGWGYRYLHGLLGNFAIFAGLGWQILTTRSTSNKKYKDIFIRTTLIMLLVALPFRAVQTNQFIKPFEKSYLFISTLPADIILLDTKSIWYGQDLVRNLPDLSNRPKIMDLRNLSTDQIKWLCHKFITYVISYNDLSTFGIRPNTKTGSVDKNMGDHIRTLNITLDNHARNLKITMKSLGCKLTKPADM